MMQLTEEQRKALIEHCKMSILEAKRILIRLENIDAYSEVARKVRKEMELQEIALAAMEQMGPCMSVEWDGTGIPPVGCECEVRCEDYADYESVRIKVFAEYKGVVIGIVNMPGSSMHDEIGKYSYFYNRARFSPLRTEAECRREAEAVNEMLKVYFSYGEPDNHNEEDKLAMSALYTAICAGKIPHITLK